MRQMGRQMTWSHAVRAFVLRYAVVNSYATCRSLGGAQTGTMFDWQCDLIRRRFCKVAVAKPIHVPVRMPGRLVCTHCYRGKTHYVCCGCGKWYHVGCFAVAHGPTGVIEVDVEEKVVEDGRGGIVDFMAAKPLPSLSMGPVRTLGDNRVGWIPKL